MTQAENGQSGVLVTGAAGRVGRALRAIWGENTANGLPLLWQSRDGGGPGGLAWDIGKNPPPVLPEGMIVLHLAGRTRGTPDDLAQNAAVTAAVCGAVRGGHVFVMSTAAVYAPGPDAIDEGVLPAPVSAYGVSKLAAERVATEVLARRGAGLTILRLANLAGADALLGGVGPVVLDPVAGQAGGPVRSYIGPRVLAQVLAALMQRPVAGVINVAQQPPVAMADLLEARGQVWRFGTLRAGVVARVVLDTERLAGLTDVPLTSAAALVADMESLR